MTTQLNIEEILTNLDIKNIRSRGKEIQFSCPYSEHKNGDRNPSASINTDTGQWVCFSCHNKGSLPKLISYVTGDANNDLLNTSSEENLSALNTINLSLPPTKPTPSTPYFPPINIELSPTIVRVDWLNEASSPSPSLHAKYMFDRGFEPSTLASHEIMFDSYTNRILIPLKNPDGHIVGFKGRSIDNSLPKYLSVGDKPDKPTVYGFPVAKTSSFIFNSHRFSKGHVVVCEGEFNAMTLCQYGYQAIALGGSNVSQDQLDILSYGFKSATLFLDNDQAGIKCSNMLASKLVNLMPVKIVTGHHADPNDLTEHECHDFIHDAKPQLFHSLGGVM